LSKNESFSHKNKTREGKKNTHKNKKLQPQNAASRMQLEVAGSWNNSLKTLPTAMQPRKLQGL
jgi:hypothetical protein